MAGMRQCLVAAILLAVISVSAGAVDKQKVRHDIIKFLRSSNMNKQLDGSVTVSQDKPGLLKINDPGNYLIQYMLLPPDSNFAVMPDIAVDEDVYIPATVNKAAIVIHGWIDKGANDWPADLAGAISEKVDPNEWVCSYYDWKSGAASLTPVYAAQYSRDIAGPRLVKALLEVLPDPTDIEHIHIIAHSAGTWAATVAAEQISRVTSANVHLTLLDSYIPPKWDVSKMAHLPSATNPYVEHYYTRDITLESTQQNFAGAHNIDLTDTQPGIKTHEFPYKWYYATITGRFRKKDHIKSKPISTSPDGVVYGFQRSLETGEANFCNSQTLAKKTNPIEIRAPKKRSIFNVASWFK